MNKAYDLTSLDNITKRIRKNIFKMINKAGGGHISPSLSIVEILTVLYFGGVLNYDAHYPLGTNRDRFILSKGHACAALYAVLAQAGFFDEKELFTFCQDGSSLGGHPNMHDIPGVEASTGALGHGLGFASGIALAGKMNKHDYQVYVLIGDGECQEGSVWETALFAASNKLDNLNVILDYNKLQAMDRLDNIVKMEPFKDKWKAFGWEVEEVEGHDIPSLIAVLTKKFHTNNSPRITIAHTVKGKGISFMEGVPIWHNRLPNEIEMQIALKELDMSMQELVD